MTLLYVARSFVLGVLAMGSTIAWSFPVADQNNQPQNGGFEAIYTNPPNSQTLTQEIRAGLSGQLTRIDLALLQYPNQGSNGVGTLDILDSTNTVLASLNFTGDLLPSYTGAPVSQTLFNLASFGLFFSTGDIFQARVSHNAAGWLGWGTTGSIYSAGQAYVTAPVLGGTPIKRSINNDFAFSTYVEPSAVSQVPEPPTWWLTALGVACFALRKRLVSTAPASQADA